MSILNLDDALSQSLSTTEAAPDFVTPENGVYVFEVEATGAEQKDTKDAKKAQAEGKPLKYIVLKLTYKITDIIEQEGAPIKPGSFTSEQFILNDQGLPYFKARIRDIAVASGGSAEDVDGLSIAEALEAVKGITFKVNAKQNKRTVDGNEIVNIRYSNIRNAEAE